MHSTYNMYVINSSKYNFKGVARILGMLGPEQPVKTKRSCPKYNHYLVRVYPQLSLGRRSPSWTPLSCAWLLAAVYILTPLWLHIDTCQHNMQTLTSEPRPGWAQVWLHYWEGPSPWFPTVGNYNISLGHTCPQSYFMWSYLGANLVLDTLIHCYCPP